MPRRDGDVFLFGTAMTVSPRVRSNRFPTGRNRRFGAVRNGGKRAYKGTPSVTLVGADAGVERRVSGGAALVQAGKPAHDGGRCAGAAA